MPKTFLPPPPRLFIGLQLAAFGSRRPGVLPEAADSRRAPWLRSGGPSSQSVAPLPQGPDACLAQRAWAGPGAGGAPLPLAPCAVCCERRPPCCRCQEGPAALWPWPPLAGHAAHAAAKALEPAPEAPDVCCPWRKGRFRLLRASELRQARAGPAMHGTAAWGRLQGSEPASCPAPCYLVAASGEGSVRPVGAPAACRKALVAPCLGGSRPARPEAGRSGPGWSSTPLSQPVCGALAGQCLEHRARAAAGDLLVPLAVDS